jgi:O-antigen/teichoic acid export membrane protein
VTPALTSLAARCTAGHVAFLRAIARRCGWTFAGTLAAQLGTMVSIILAARLLDQVTFGSYAAIQNTAVTLANVGSAGLGIAATRYLAETGTTSPERAGRIAALLHGVSIATGMLFSATTTLFSAEASTLLFGHSAAAGALRLVGVHVFFTTVSGFQAGALQGLGAFSAVAFVNILQAVVQPLAVFSLAARYGLSGAVIAMNIGAIATWSGQRFILRRVYRQHGITPQFRGCGGEFHLLPTFTLPAAFSGIIGNLGIWASNAILLRSFDGVVQFAIFSAATTFRSLVLFVPAVIHKAAVPFFVQLHAKQQHRFSDVFWSNVQLNAAFAAVIATSIVCLGRPLLELFGRQYIGSSTLALLMAAACLEVVAIALYQAVLIRGAIWLHAGCMMIWSVVITTSTFVLAGTLGSNALALGHCLAWLIAIGIYAGYALSTLSNIPSAGEPSLSRKGTKVSI